MQGQDASEVETWAVFVGHNVPMVGESSWPDSEESAQRLRDEAVVRDSAGLRRSDVIEYDEEGWDSRVYVVNGGEAVFKFPRTSEAKRQYRLEIDTLKLLQRAGGPVLTPTVKWEGPDLAYFGYEGIVGRQVSKLLATLRAEDKEAIGSSIGDFLKTLHGMQLPSARRITIEDEILNYRHKLRLARPALTQGLSVEEVRAVEAFFVEQLPAAMRDLGGQLRLSHGDLGPWNIIVSTTGAIGVIDFGDIGYQDVSKDFSGFGDRMVLHGAFDSYGADQLLRKKAALRIKAFPVLDIPFYLGKADRVGVRSCLNLVRRVIIGGNVTADDRFRRDLG